MTATQSVPLEEIRSIPEIVNVSFDYFRSRSTLLRPVLMKYVVPLILISQLMLQLVSTDSFAATLSELMIGVNLGEQFLPVFFSPGTTVLVIIVALILLSIGAALLVAVVYGTMNLDRLYDNSDGQGFDADDVWNEAKSHLGMIIATTLGFAILLGLALIVLIRFIGPIDLFGPILFIIAMIALPAFLIYWTLIFPVRVFEGASFLTAFDRSRRLIEGAWWKTLWLLLLFLLLSTALTFIEVFPIVILWVLFTTEVVIPTSIVVNIIFFLLYSVLETLRLLLGIMPVFALGFHFFSQRERREGPLLLAEVEGFGQEDEPESIRPYDDTGRNDDLDTLDQRGAFNAS